MKGTDSKKVVWSAADYASNSVVQQTWARELIAGLHLRGDERILDVGCGDGKITAEIARAVPRGAAVGVDASPQMIGYAQKTFPSGKNPNLEFHVMDAREIKSDAFLPPSPPQKDERAGVRRQTDLKSHPLSPERHLTPTLSPTSWRRGRRSHSLREAQGVNPRNGFRENPSPLGRDEESAPALFDIVFSNAALHWVDDHQAFLRGAASVLKPGGRLVVSCGGKGNAYDVFLALRPEMRLKRWREFFRKMEAPYFFHSPEEYKKWLPRFGFRTRSVKLAPKDATYPGREGFAGWLRTTWLPYTQRVPEKMRKEFIAGVVERYVAKHPVGAKGLVHVRMVRLEIDATRL